MVGCGHSQHSVVSHCGGKEEEDIITLHGFIVSIISKHLKPHNITVNTIDVDLSDVYET